MSTCYVFVRAWVGFSQDFPFDEFNCLPDDQIVPALEAYCRKWFAENKPELVRRCRNYRGTEKIEHVVASMREAWERGSLPKPPGWRRRAMDYPLYYAGMLLDGHEIPWVQEKDQYSPADFVHFAERDRRQRWQQNGPHGKTRPSMGFRIAVLAGWVTPQEHARDFGGYCPTNMYLLAETPAAETAARLVHELQHGQHKESLALDIDSYQLRFGYLPADQVSPALQVSFGEALEGHRGDHEPPLKVLIEDNFIPLARRILYRILPAETQPAGRRGGERRPKADRVDASDDGDGPYPASYYVDNHNISADRLRNAVRRKRLTRIKINGNRNGYRKSQVKALWPECFVSTPKA